MTFALRTRHLPVKTGIETYVGKTGWVYQALKPTGQVKVNGEIWSAELVDGEPGPLPPNCPIVVVAVEGLHLRVKKT
jgi:membrane protein implicated in regulation of membrane protease activity